MSSQAAIPIPEVGGLPPKPYRCPCCRRKFFTLRGYQGHYALEHILAPRPKGGKVMRHYTSHSDAEGPIPALRWTLVNLWPIWLWLAVVACFDVGASSQGQWLIAAVFTVLSIAVAVYAIWLLGQIASQRPKGGK